MAEKKKTLIILDSNSLVHRAFHALPPFTSNKGELVNAVYGFLLVFFKVVKDLKPDYVAAAFDLSGPTFRHKEFAEYKAKRAKAPDELYAQIPMIKGMLEKLGVPIFEKQGFEADDLIGVLAKKATVKKGINSIKLAAEAMRHEPPSMLAGFLDMAPELGELGDYLTKCFGAFDFKNVRQVLPTLTFEKEMTRQVGAKTVKLMHVGPAHTPGDVLAFVPEDKTVFTGDIL